MGAAAAGEDIDPDLRLRQSDLLYRTRLDGGDEAWVYLLFEHKSYVDRLVSLQLLGYVVRIWERDARTPGAGSRPLRPIIPIVLYHGSSPWSGPTRIGELVAGAHALATHGPELSFTLVDLSDRSDAEIAGGVALRVILMVLQASRMPDLGQRLPGILALLTELVDQRSALGWLEVVLRYVSLTSDVVTESELKQAAQDALSKPGGRKMATLVEQWLEQGRKENIDLVHEGIGLALAERFGTAGEALMPEIRAIREEDTLRRIMHAMWKVDSIDALRATFA